jgi:hypothetical protein
MSVPNREPPPLPLVFLGSFVEIEMKFNVKGYCEYIIVTAEEGNTFLDIGMLDKKQANALVSQLQDAIDELKYYIGETEDATNEL